MVQQSVLVLQEFGIGPLPLNKKQKLLLPRLLKKQQTRLPRLLKKQQTQAQTLRLKLKQKQIREQKIKKPELKRKLLPKLLRKKRRLQQQKPKLTKKLLKRRKNRNQYKLVNKLIALEKPSLSSQSEKRKLLRKALSMAKQTRKPLWDMLSLHLPSSPSS